jgi:hypothetical protein
MATLELDISAIPMFASWSQQFNAIRTDSRGNKSNVNTEATWSIDGSLPPDQAGIVIGGNYTAPSSITSPLTVVLRATHTFQGEVLTDTATISLGTFYPTESVAAITPSTGSAVPGTFQEFLLTVPLSGHDYNAAYRWPIELHFSESASAVANSCKIVWVTGGVHGSAGLVDDDGNPPPQFYALHGVASPTPDNLQCAVDLQQSYLYIQPGYVNEYLHFYIRFKPRFAGPKMIYLQVFDNLTGSYLVAPGTNLGTFLIPGYQPPSLAIETPATGATVSGAAVPITGWALDNAAQEETAISKVEVYVDGTKVGDAQYGLAHATACSSGQYPGRPGCPNVGYSFNWNSASVANGEHTILVSATDTDLLSGLADPHVASKAITVTVANTVSVAVSPATATLYRAQTTQFTAQVQGTTNTGVTWSLSPLVGTITAAGLYTAPDSITSQQTVQVIATSLADGTKTAQAVVTLVPVTLSLSLSDVSLNLNQTQQFTASLTPAGSGLNWSLSPSLGALSTTTTTVATNTYTAPSAVNSAQTVILTVSSVLDPSKAAQATIHLVPIAISVSPATVQLTAYQTQDFTATVTGTSNTAYTWALSPSVGTVSSTGHYEAPGSIEAQQTVTISATSSADPSKVATAAIILAPPVAEAPVNVSMTPSSGFGLTQTFSFVSSSTNGYRYIRSMHALFNYSTTAGGACYANYDATSNTLYLMSDNNDPGATTSGVLGSTGSLENAECRIDLGASSTSGSFNSLTLNLAITFKAGLPGPQNAYMLTYDMDYRYAGWEQKGTWTTSTVLSTAPTAVSVTPSFGTGMAATLSFVGSSANGYSYIPDLMALVSSTVTGTNACFVYYNRPRNCVTLLTDSGAWGQCSSLGTVGTLENSQCSLDLATSSASGAGNDLTLSLGLTFKTPYTGAKNTYLKVWDRANRTSDWVQLGTWNVAVNQTPAPVSVTPSSGTGFSQIYTAVYADGNGASDLAETQLLVHSSATTANACNAAWRPGSGFYLRNDAGTGWLGPVAAGASATLQNSQCLLSAANSSAGTSGNNATVNYAISLLTGFAGARNLYLSATDGAGAGSGWQQLGTWTAGAVAEAPVNVSMTPSSGFGLTQTFSFVSSSTNGYRYIRSMHALFNYSTTAGGACYANYDATSNTLYLMSDNNDPGATTSGVLGSTGSLENAECRIDLGASSTSGSFNSLTLNLAITFKAGLPGPQNAYMLTYDMDYRYAGWEQKGTWTTSTVLSTAPTAVSVTPSFGTGMAATLSFVGSSANGYSYIPDLMALVSSTVTGTNACFVYYNRPRNCVTLLTDSGAWGQCSSLGTVGTLENSQCSLDLATSSASGAGNDLTLSLGLTFKTPYTGAKNTYLKVWDRANRTSDWVQLGTWNVGTN